MVLGCTQSFWLHWVSVDCFLFTYSSLHTLNLGSNGDWLHPRDKLNVLPLLLSHDKEKIEHYKIWNKKMSPPLPIIMIGHLKTSNKQWVLPNLIVTRKFKGLKTCAIIPAHNSYSKLSVVSTIVIHPHISIQHIYQIFILFCLHVLTSLHLVGWVDCTQSLKKSFKNLYAKLSIDLLIVKKSFAIVVCGECLVLDLYSRIIFLSF